jgi:hypothetical protein
MIDHGTYKLVHLSGIFLMIMSFGSLIYQSLIKEENQPQGGLSKRNLSIIHGVGLLMVLIGGFGMLARQGVVGAWPNWVSLKFTIWLILTFMIIAIKKFKDQGSLFFWFIILMAMTAAYLGIKHPQIG